MSLNFHNMSVSTVQWTIQLMSTWMVSSNKPPPLYSTTYESQIWIMNIITLFFSWDPSSIYFAWPKFLQLPLWCRVLFCKLTHLSLCDRQTLYLIAFFFFQLVPRTCHWCGRETEIVHINHRFTNVSAKVCKHNDVVFEVIAAAHLITLMKWSR